MRIIINFILAVLILISLFLVKGNYTLFLIIVIAVYILQYALFKAFGK